MAFDENVVLEDGGSENRESIVSKGYVTGEWLHVAWRTVVRGAIAEHALTFDGVAVGTTTSSAAPFGESSRITVGESGVTAPDTEWRVRIDNLVVDLR